MKQIVVIAAACLMALSVAGCAVEVPMSAFRMAPPKAGQAAATKSPQDPYQKAEQELSR